MLEIPNTPRARKLIYLIAFVSLALALGLIYCKDDKLEDRSDLALILPSSDPKDNLVLKLQTSTTLDPLIRDKDRQNLTSKLSREDFLIQFKPIFDKHAAAMAELHSLLKPGVYFRSIPAPGASAASTYLPALGAAREATNAISQQANLLTASGKPEEALVLLAAGEAWLDKSNEQTDNLIHHLVCIAISGILNSSKAKAIAVCADREILKRLSSAQDKDLAWRQALRQGYKSDCHYFEAMLADIQSKPASQTALPKVFDYLPKRLFLKPNQTLNREADLMRLLLQACDAKDFAAIKIISHDLDEKLLVYAGEKGVVFFLRPNFAGRVYLKMMIPALGNVSSKMCIAIARDRQVRTLAALRLYELDSGHLPATLDELVPRYFDAVPLDPGDSKPLRYLPAKRAVYSINRNGDLSDDGGDPKSDTVLRLDWDQE